MDIRHELGLTPFLKWAGGKRWLPSKDPELFPRTFHTYYEPFLGGAAIYFHLSPKRAVLSDINSELINTYRAIRDNWSLVLRYLKQHHKLHSTEYYYRVRAQVPRSPYALAARMLYLNRTCWNGLYRVNQGGHFNVPVGTKTNVLLDTDDFCQTAKLLAGAELHVSDFEKTIDLAGKNDFVFVDPPYTVKHNLNGFIKYNENLFAWEDQVRLRDSINRAVDRGAMALITNAAHDSVRELYAAYPQRIFSRKNVLSGKKEYRGVYEELSVRCGY